MHNCNKPNSLHIASLPSKRDTKRWHRCGQKAKNNIVAVKSTWVAISVNSDTFKIMLVFNLGKATIGYLKNDC